METKSIPEVVFFRIIDILNQQFHFAFVLKGKSCLDLWNHSFEGSLCVCDAHKPHHEPKSVMNFAVCAS